ncbi:MOS1T transposase, partial [Pseudoatta argentina]
MNKSAAEAHRILVDVYSEHALAEQTCRKWFARFKAGDFDLDDKERPGQPKKFEDNDLQALLNENSCQTLKELSTLEVDFSTIGKLLKSLGMIQKEGHWVPYELKPRDIERLYLRGILLHYFIQKKSAAEAHRILVQTYDDNALSDTTCRTWFRRLKNNDFELEGKERSGAPKKFQDKELEQLLDEDPSQTLSELGKILHVDESTVSKRLKGLGMIQKQGHWVPRALKEKRPLYAQRHDKVILLHDNARPHVAKPVKTYLETLKWEVLPHPPYSPDIAPSDFHLFPVCQRGRVTRNNALRGLPKGLERAQALISDDPGQSLQKLASIVGINEPTMRRIAEEDKSYTLKIRQMVSEAARTSRVAHLGSHSGLPTAPRFKSLELLRSRSIVERITNKSRQCDVIKDRY